jgi:hypothetical protein
MRPVLIFTNTNYIYVGLMYDVATLADSAIILLNARLVRTFKDGKHPERLAITGPVNGDVIDDELSAPVALHDIKLVFQLTPEVWEKFKIYPTTESAS